jgi:rhodanese-related sulfurtransferase
MKRRAPSRAWAAAVSVALLCASAGLAAAQAVPRISKEELRVALGGDDVMVIDLRIPNEYDPSPGTIPGAVRENPMDIRYWYPYPKDKTIVLYCG